ncbi:MAG: YjbQ family protein [Candidatus Dadabacteria bacterium]|nr:MAG: YjbQ family protein [Candidatus Dadabacteria bacterium]
MQFEQKELVLAARPRGLHLVTRDIVAQLPTLSGFQQGMCHLLLLHTSAALTINENASPEVAADLADDLDRLVPDGRPGYRHTIEGPDDMAAHTKTTLAGSALMIPVRKGALWLGTWQGIFLCEFRNDAPRRHIAATLFGP